MADPQQQASPFTNFPNASQINAMQPAATPAPQQQASFDVNGARQAGYSDDQILGELTQRHQNFDVNGALQAGYSKGDIINELAGGASEQPIAPTDYLTQAKNLAKNYGTKAAEYMYGIGSGAAQSIPFIGKYLKPPADVEASIENPDIAKFGETSGKIMEPAAEMVAMGGPLRYLAEEGAVRWLPWLGKFGAPLARIAAESATAATSAKLHDQPVGPSAAIGAGGAALSEGLAAAAPKFAESALKITDRMRGSGRTIGPAVLEETTGITPGAVAKSGATEIKNLTTQMEQGVHDATAAGAVGSSQPAHNALDAAIANTPRNAPEVVDKLEELRTKLGFPFDPANPQKAYTPDELLEMKRGINKAIKSWPPEWQRSEDVLAAKQRIYGALDGELDRLVPGNHELNQRISSLIPAKSQAARLSQGAGMIQRIAGRVGAHTGALAGSLYGGHKYGLPGYIAGAAIPEMIGSPTGQMAMARMMQLGIPTAIARGIVASQEPAPGSAGQFERSMQAPNPSGGNKLNNLAEQFGRLF